MKRERERRPPPFEGVDPRQRVPDTIVTKGFHATWNNLSLSVHARSPTTPARLAEENSPTYASNTHLMPASADTSGKHPDPGSKIRKLRKPSCSPNEVLREQTSISIEQIYIYIYVYFSSREKEGETKHQTGLLKLFFSSLYLSALPPFDTLILLWGAQREGDEWKYRGFTN